MQKLPFTPMTRDEMGVHRASFGEMWRENCPFCDKDRHHKNDSFLSETSDWYTIHNLAPYNAVTGHLMAMVKRHVETVLDFGADEHADFPNVLRDIQDYFTGKVFFQFTRETLGPTRTVGHFHTHFLPGKMALFGKEMDWIYTSQDARLSAVSQSEYVRRQEIIRLYQNYKKYAGWSDQEIRTYHMSTKGEILDEGEYYQIIRENEFHETGDDHVILLETKQPESEKQQEVYVGEQEKIHKYIQRYFNFRPLSADLADEPRNYFSFTKENTGTRKETHFLAGQLHFDSKMKEFVWLHPGQAKPPLM